MSSIILYPESFGIFLSSLSVTLALLIGYFSEMLVIVNIVSMIYDYFLHYIFSGLST